MAKISSSVNQCWRERQKKGGGGYGGGEDIKTYIEVRTVLRGSDKMEKRKKGNVNEERRKG